MNSFSDVAEQKFDVLFNCTGLGAKELCNDAQLVPMRGQVLKVRAPWVKLAFYGDYDTYILPGFETVSLGGCRQYDSFNLNICKYDSMAIKERCYGMLPSLKRAEVVCEAVGLRPHRAVVSCRTIVFMFKIEYLYMNKRFFFSFFFFAYVGARRNRNPSFH